MHIDLWTPSLSRKRETTQHQYAGVPMVSAVNGFGYLKVVVHIIGQFLKATTFVMANEALFWESTRQQIEFRAFQGILLTSAGASHATFSASLHLAILAFTLAALVWGLGTCLDFKLGERAQATLPQEKKIHAS